MREDGALDQGGKTDKGARGQKEGSRRMPQCRDGWVWVVIPTLWTPSRKKPKC